MAPQAQSKAMTSLQNAAPTTKNKHAMTNTHDPTAGNGSRKPLDNITTYTDDYLRVLYRDWETDRKSTRLNSSHRL